MGSIALSTIITDVETCIDEIASNDAEFDALNQDNIERASIIASKIPDALSFVYGNADLSLLKPDASISAVANNDKMCMECVVPDDMLRMLSAKVSSWTRSLTDTDLILDTDKAYTMLGNKHTTGTNIRPKMAKVNSSSGIAKYELYPKGDEASILYVRIPVIENDAVSIQARLYRPIIYYIAGLTLTTYFETDKANAMFNEANDLMGFTPKAPVQPNLPQQ